MAEPAPEWAVQWCGSAEGFTVAGRAISPCFLETGMLAVISALSIAVGVMNVPALHHAVSLRRSGSKEKGPVGISGGEFGAILGASFAVLIHLLHLASAIMLHLSPSHTSMHAVLLAVWSAMLYSDIYVSKVHVLLDFRPLTAVCTVFYTWSLVTFWSLYRVTTDYPLPYQRSMIWSLMLFSVLSLLLFVLDWQRHKSTVHPDGYEPLPTAAGPGDIEAGTGGKVLRMRGPPGPGGGPGGMGPGGTAAALDRAGSSPLVDPDNQLSWLTIFWESCESMWPEDIWLKLRMVLSIVLLLVMRGLNLLVPMFYKRVVDTASSLAGGDSTTGLIFGWLSPWVVAYLIAIFFQGGAGGGMMGMLNNLRQILWLPVAQDSYKRTTLKIFAHMLDLDLSFHLSRKTGEITKQVERGTNAIQNMLSTILFNIMPTLIDLLTASTYLAQAMEPSIAVTVFLTVGSYIPVTILITEWRSSLRREMNRTDQAVSARITDALLNFETVKYFTNEAHEKAQLHGAIKAYQSAEFLGMASLNLLNVIQSFIMWVGISVGLLFCNLGLKRGELTVGDMVLFLSLMAQLLAPLNWLGSFVRTIQQYVIDFENLHALLQQRSKVQDKPACKDLLVTQARVDYDDVSFYYEPNAPVLKHVSFSVPGGKTIAFVGATGSGKSTITRLMFRFYDVTGGCIRVDGQDIRDVSQSSLRRAVGMVPQDTVLFNDTILMNIRYGRLDATDEEVYAAAEAACIHEAITTRFPKGYSTLVGERGLKLSGGEKQRVAFARALLKNPTILVLDEATSALDTLTERKIQGALASLRSSRTTMIVAHRLSTIVDADIIVAMHLGEVKEIGSHTELLAKQGGLYSELWHKQLTTHDGVEVGASSLSAASNNGGSAHGGGANEVNGANGVDAAAATPSAFVASTVAVADSAVAGPAAAAAAGEKLPELPVSMAPQGSASSASITSAVTTAGGEAGASSAAGGEQQAGGAGTSTGSKGGKKGKGAGGGKK